MTETTLEDIARKLDALAPHIAGIPSLQNSIDVLQREVRILRDELRINSAMVQRTVNAANDRTQMINAIHQWMIGICFLWLRLWMLPMQSGKYKLDPMGMNPILEKSREIKEIGRDTPS